MKSTFSKDDQQRFLTTMSSQDSVNFPAIADILEIKWEAVEKALRRDRGFREALAAVLQRMKWRFVQSINELAIKGPQGKFAPDPKYINMMIKWIDDGTFLNISAGSTASNDPGDSDGLSDEEKKRLGV